MKLSLATHFARRRPLGLVVALCWLVIAPICQAQCLQAPDATSAEVVAAVVAEDCHGIGQRDVPKTTDDCDWPHDPTHSGSDRVDTPAPMVAALWSSLVPVLTPAVRVAARQDPSFHGQGPPLRLLTLRFIE